MEDHGDRRFATAYFNEVWRLLGKDDRTADDDARMIHIAHGSLAHWLDIGGALEWSVGEWQVSRVYATLGMIAAAVYHAERALALADANDLSPFYRASAREGLARALRWTDPARATALRSEAAALAAAIDDEEDRAVLLQDLTE